MYIYQRNKCLFEFFNRWNTKKKLKFFIKSKIVLGKKKHKEVNVFTPYT